VGLGGTADTPGISEGGLRNSSTTPECMNQLKVVAAYTVRPPPARLLTSVPPPLDPVGPCSQKNRYSRPQALSSSYVVPNAACRGSGRLTTSVASNLTTHGSTTPWRICPARPRKSSSSTCDGASRSGRNGLATAWTELQSAR